MKMWVILFLVFISFFVYFYNQYNQRSESMALKGKNQIDTAKIAAIFDVKPEEFSDEGVIKVSFSRTDIIVTVEDIVLDPFMGFTSWIGFQKGSKRGIEVMVMGDLVLLEHEVEPTMRTALDNAIKVTALHNHFFYENPKIYFMHIEAEGSLYKVSTGIKQTLEAKNTVQKNIVSPISNNQNNITGSAIESILGVKGNAKNGMFKIVIGRHTHSGCGCPVGKNMGINTWAAFAGIDDNAIVTGDFAMLEDELHDVLRALCDAGIKVVAIHNHMTHEKPRIIFLHFWGRGNATNLAYGIKRALNQTNTFNE